MIKRSKLTVLIKCANCQTHHPVEKKRHDYNARRGQKLFFCSRRCSGTFNGKDAWFEKVCPVCNEAFETLGGTKEKTLCSRNCSNLLFAQRAQEKRNVKKVELLCLKCGTNPVPIGKNGRSRPNKVCHTCAPHNMDKNPLKIAITRQTKGDLFAKSKSWQSARSTLQGHARSVLVFTRKLRCHLCGYAKHVHTSHIKPVSTFSDDTLIGIINHPDNLVPLCPNHHWEFDAGLLVLVPDEGHFLERD